MGVIEDEDCGDRSVEGDTRSVRGVSFTDPNADTRHTIKGDETRTGKDVKVDIRLIDFAHSQFLPGVGQDEGVIFGLLIFLEEKLRLR